MNKWTENMFTARYTARNYSIDKKPNIWGFSYKHEPRFIEHEGREGWLTSNNMFFGFDKTQIYPPKKIKDNKRHVEN